LIVLGDAGLDLADEVGAGSAACGHKERSGQGGVCRLTIL
jgi:hypothetical protein